MLSIPEYWAMKLMEFDIMNTIRVLWIYLLMAKKWSISMPNLRFFWFDGGFRRNSARRKVTRMGLK